MIARRFFVNGMVQGVGFRYFAQRAAAKHQVKGFVRNMPDGRVETFVQGSETQVNGFRDDIATGPRFSKVDDIEELVEDINLAFSTFRIER
ncbi:MAG: acylphosphatase [Pyrinomonadaceae bacterium]